MSRGGVKVARTPPRKAGRYAVALGLFVLLLAVLSATYVFSCPLPEDSPGVAIYVAPGTSTAAVADMLHENGIIRSPFAFRALARLLQADGRLQTGEYRFEPGTYAWDAITSLKTGRVLYYSVTVPEGFTVEQIASLIEERGFGRREEILKLCKDKTLLPIPVEESLDKVRYPLEGYLFPDTYYVRRGMSEKEIVGMMLKRFETVFTKELRAEAKDAGMSLHEVATLASIVESEAYAAEERPIIAGVYLNRLKLGMKLGADPTVIYAVGQKAGYVLLWKDLEVESPYNTYVNVGLPPGPIGNFGKACLEAVLSPADVNYLYFVAKPDRTHAFARTLTEHNRNIATYLGK